MLKVSFVIPTLNEESRLRACLDSIKMQDYPNEYTEIIIADGGSTDKTIEIADEYNVRVFDNPLKTSESGKVVGVRNSTGEIICFVDADNVIPNRDWLGKIVEPLFDDPELVGIETIRFTWRAEDGFIDRYCALMGMNDPINLWLKSYDRMNLLTGKWTGLPVEYVWKDGYIVATLENGKIPTIGANGCLFRKEMLWTGIGDGKEYLFDLDILETIVEKNGPQKFALADIGIIHMYCGSSLRKFAKKQLRRVKDYLYRRGLKDIFIVQNFEKRTYKYGHVSSLSLIFSVTKFIISCLLVVPLIYQSVIGYRKKRDVAWFAHPLLCWITLLVYTYGACESFIFSGELSRENW